jgi:hypothetical protein
MNGEIAMRQHEWDAARIIRDFSRVGIGAAAIVAISGLALTAIVADRDYETTTQWPGTPVAKADPPDVPPWANMSGSMMRRSRPLGRRF